MKTALLIALIAVTAAADSPPFPSGTSEFPTVAASDAVPAAGGGVWIATPQGIIHYTAAGAGTVLTVPGGTPAILELAADGSIWFATASLIGRISTSGAVLEQYAEAGVRDIAVASDGALWYSRGGLGSIIGRIAGGAVTEFPSPTQSLSLAPAGGGAMWVLGNGFGTSPDSLYQLSPTGAATVLPLGQDTLFGRLQATPDGTLYIGTGYRDGLLRLLRGSTSVEPITWFHDEMFLIDGAGNLWSTTGSTLHFAAASGSPRFAVQLPFDPRAGSCVNIPSYAYWPLAVDSDGGLWLRIFDQAAYIGESPPCTLPIPPPMPALVRLDAQALIAAHATSDIPSLSPAMLGILAMLIALAGTAFLRRDG